MAYTALASLEQTIDQILNDSHYALSLRRKEIISIRDDAISLQEFFEDFPEKAMSLEERITEAANKAEDIIEYFTLGKIPSECGLIKSTVGQTKVKFDLRKVAEKMKSIVEEVKGTKNRVNRIKDAGLIRDSPPASSSNTLASTGKNDMIGRDDYLMAIKKWLCGESFLYEDMGESPLAIKKWENLLCGESFLCEDMGESSLCEDMGESSLCEDMGESSLCDSLQILTIVGMGGIGKTTLARNVYDDFTIVNRFDIRAWVTVSQHHNVEEILASLLVSMGVPRKNIAGKIKELLMEMVRKNLSGRTYLIVMDDVWSGEAWDEAWDRMKYSFPDDHVRSQIILTTRDSGIALCLGYECFKMSLMDADQSWDLLRHKVFGYGSCPDELEDIGKEIARSCGGLPLLIVLVAETLSTVSQTRASWESIAESVISAVATKDGRCEMMISSSYTQLPHYLRPCLLYMVGFPQDYEIRVSKLIKLWVAEGFVKTYGYKTLEEMAEAYLEDLVYRSLVLVTSRKSDGKIRSCSLHDVVQDFCIRRVQEEKFFLPVMDYLPNTSLRRYFLPQILEKQRRISVTSYDLDIKDSIYNSPIRTIICIPQSGYRSMGSVENFRLLRVLHVVRKNDDWDWVPGQVFELIHLRYLASNIPFIPAAISKLKHLQTLIIYRHDVRLPVEIWRLPQLRHLIAFSFDPLTHPEGAIFRLEKLQTLSVATNFVCSERILEMIASLKKLAICYSEDKFFDEDYHLDNLQYLYELENLKLEIHRDFPLGRYLNLVFPSSLKRLALSGLRLPWQNMEIVGSLPKLEVLKLRDLAFQGDIWETTQGEFPHLKFLLIDQSDLQHWVVTDSGHFPSLKRLLLHHCPYLSEIPREIGEIWTLQLIEVDDLNGSLVDSAKILSRDYGVELHVKHL